MLPTDDPVAGLLVRWDELRRQGTPISPEELCRDCPELLPAVRERIEGLESMARWLLTSASSAGDTAGSPASLSPSRIRGCERLQPGRVVRGYTLVGPIGRGGFGEVWKARGPSGFPVALKFVPYSADAGEAELRSLKIIRELRHPNLISVFGAWGTRDLIVIAMELADGTLWDRFREVTAGGLPGIPRSELVEYLRQAAGAIDYLNAPRHRLGGKDQVGVQHRDIKPQNLLLVGGGVKVADLGLAHPVRGVGTSHTGNMTVLYAAPEFFSGRTTRWSDQYSLAVTYCMLRGGRPPFAGEAAQVMRGHLHRLPDLTMLPEEERPALARALAKAPEQRWPSCRAFIDSLARAAPPGVEVGRVTVESTASRGVEARPVAIPVGDTTGRRPRRGTQAEQPPRRRVFPVRRLAVILAALCGAGMLAWGLYSHGAPWLRRHLGSHVGHPVEGESTFVPQPRVFKGHEGSVYALAVSEDGRHALSGGGDHTMRLWDLQTGKELLRLGHPDDVDCVALSPDGRYALSGCDDKLIRVWDLTNPDKPIRLLEGHEDWVRSVSFLSDERGASSIDSTAVYIWDVPGGKVVRRRPRLLTGSPPRPIDLRTGRVSPDGKRVLIGLENGALDLWGIEGSVVAKQLKGHKPGVRAVCFSPDGRRALSGGDDSTVRLWDIESPGQLHRFDGHTKAVRSVAFLSDGRHALSAGEDGTVRVWALPTRETAQTLSDPVGEVQCYTSPGVSIKAIAAGPKGNWFVSGGSDGMLRLERVQVPERK